MIHIKAESQSSKTSSEDGGKTRVSHPNSEVLNDSNEYDEKTQRSEAACPSAVSSIQYHSYENQGQIFQHPTAGPRENHNSVQRLNHIQALMRKNHHQKN